jgi:hypothetical protein
LKKHWFLLQDSAQAMVPLADIVGTPVQHPILIPDLNPCDFEAFQVLKCEV